MSRKGKEKDARGPYIKCGSGSHLGSECYAQAMGRTMMDDLARLYRFIEDAEVKAAILEVLIDFRGRGTGRAWDTQLSLTVVSAPAQTQFERKGKTMKAEKDDGYKCPRCDDHIPEQFYCLNCGYVAGGRLETYKTHREAA